MMLSWSDVMMEWRSGVAWSGVERSGTGGCGGVGWGRMAG